MSVITECDSCGKQFCMGRQQSLCSDCAKHAEQRCPRCGLPMGRASAEEEAHATRHLRDDFAMVAMPSFLAIAAQRIAGAITEGRGSYEELEEGARAAVSSAYGTAALALAERDGAM